MLDETTFPKAGQHSVGARASAHCGALGKKANCRCAVSLHYVPPRSLSPVDAAGAGRGACGGTSGLDQRPDRPGVALAKLGAEGWPGRGVMADAASGISGLLGHRPRNGHDAHVVIKILPRGEAADF
ncbi:MAG: transposase [Verrucomicrobia bacterium]|nr:transposase [Verrucomicrobiota bacterium]